MTQVRARARRITQATQEIAMSIVVTPSNGSTFRNEPMQFWTVYRYAPPARNQSWQRRMLRGRATGVWFPVLHDVLATNQ